jgi:hypothetical protein
VNDLTKFDTVTLTRVADLIEARMGPLFGSPEYLADPVKRGRSEKRRRESAEFYASVAIQATAADNAALRRSLRALLLGLNVGFVSNEVGQAARDLLGNEGGEA